LIGRRRQFRTTLRDAKLQNHPLSLFHMHPEAKSIRQQRPQSLPHSSDSIDPLIVCLVFCFENSAIPGEVLAAMS
jgi:hypothetical protein